MSYTIKSVERVENEDDLLVVTAINEDGKEITATGWASVITNHFAPDQYQEYAAEDVENSEVPVGTIGRHLKPDAQSRTMTAAEVGEYAKRLVSEQHPQHAPTPIRTPISFEA